MRSTCTSKKLLLLAGQLRDVCGRRQQNQATAITALVHLESRIDDANYVQVAFERFFEVADALLRERRTRTELVL